MINYDKLKNIETDETYFDFKCTECGANGKDKNVFDIKPIGISWRPVDVDNSDIKNEIIQEELNKLPRLRNYLRDVIVNQPDNYTKILIVCNKCKMSVNVYETIKPKNLRDWVNKHLPVYLDFGNK